MRFHLGSLYGSRYELGAKYDWDAEDVPAFLRCQRVLSRNICRKCAGTGLTASYAEELLRK